MNIELHIVNPLTSYPNLLLLERYNILKLGFKFSCILSEKYKLSKNSTCFSCNLTQNQHQYSILINFCQTYAP